MIADFMALDDSEHLKRYSNSQVLSSIVLASTTT